MSVKNALEAAVEKISRGMIACLILICSLGTTAFAQTNPCKGYQTGIQQTIVGGLPKTYAPANCAWEPTLSYNCAVYLCPGASSVTEVRSTCPACGSPIGLNTGNTYIEEMDTRIPGLSSGLTLTRTWNSLWPLTQTSFQIGLFGMNWRSTYEERIFLDGDGFYKYSRSDGSFWSFGGGGSLYVVAPSNVNATLTANSQETQWTLTFQNGEKRIFDITSGSLTAIVDRNGNTTLLTYDGENRLASVADPGGRHLYLGYANNSSSLVTSVTTDVGISLLYSYDSSSRLTQVTNPDLTTLTFTYDTNSMITAVTDSNSKVLESHTYDSCGRGLSSSRSGGIEAVTVTYSQACMQAPVIGLDFP